MNPQELIILLILISTVILSLLSATLYRIGGVGGTWYFNTKVRDAGCPLCMLAWFWWNGLFHWTLWLCFGLMFSALTTYWKRGDTAYWYHWAMTGAGYGLAMFPLIIHTGAWPGFIYRVAALCLLTTVWSVIISEDWLEEGGRGLFIVATLPILIIGG